MTDWRVIETLVQWLDDNDGMTRNPDLSITLRVAKITEEAGEAVAALIGVFGQNPRKGKTAAWTDVEAELCDVIITAMVALRSISPHAEQLLTAALERVATRALERKSS